MLDDMSLFIVYSIIFLFFFFQAEDGIRDLTVTGVQTCALPIYRRGARRPDRGPAGARAGRARPRAGEARPRGQVHRSEEHTSELQSQSNLVCRLLLEKKKKQVKNQHMHNKILQHLTARAISLVR